MMKPYYQDEHCTIYNADCREVLPELGQFDLLLTDPPYGIADKWVGGKGHGWGKADTAKEVRNSWDGSAPSMELINMCISHARHSIIWGGNYFDLKPSRCWLVWNKPERGFTLAEGELAWTNADNVLRVFDCNRSDPGREHPTQKPIELMRWCMGLSWSKKSNTILDPFMGSGTTLRAAKDLGRKAVGIELEERYCEIAANRLSQGVLDLGV